MKEYLGIFLLGFFPLGLAIGIAVALGCWEEKRLLVKVILAFAIAMVIGGVSMWELMR